MDSIFTQRCALGREEIAKSRGGVLSQAVSGHGHSLQAEQSTRVGVHHSGNMFQTEPGPLPQPFSFAAGQIIMVCVPCQIPTSPRVGGSGNKFRQALLKIKNCLKGPCNVNALKCVHCQGLLNRESPQWANYIPLKKPKQQNTTKFSRELWGVFTESSFTQVW